MTGSEHLNPADRILLAAEFAKRWNSVLMLKGLPTAIGFPDGSCYISEAGNPALATAGTGDVLAGLCAGYRAQGIAAENAAVLGLHTGGIASDLYIKEAPAATMTALDQLALIPDAITYLTRGPLA